VSYEGYFWGLRDVMDLARGEGRGTLYIQYHTRRVSYYTSYNDVHNLPRIAVSVVLLAMPVVW
jgi:hypothetical protein